MLIYNVFRFSYRFCFLSLLSLSISIVLVVSKQNIWIEELRRKDDNTTRVLLHHFFSLHTKRYKNKNGTWNFGYRMAERNRKKNAAQMDCILHYCEQHPFCVRLLLHSYVVYCFGVFSPSRVA